MKITERTQTPPTKPPERERPQPPPLPLPLPAERAQAPEPPKSRDVGRNIDTQA